MSWSGFSKLLKIILSKAGL